MGSRDFWIEIKTYYDQGLYTDMELLAGDSRVGLRCHQLVMASVSKAIRTSLKSSLATSNDASDPVYVLLPEFTYAELSAFTDAIYHSLAKIEVDNYFDVTGDLSVSLDLRILPGMRAWDKQELDHMKQVLAE